MRIVFLLFLAFFSLINPSNSLLAQENQDIYTVEDVAVNVVANSPSAARNLAVKTARKDAFLILLARINLDIAIADSISEDEITEMVLSEQVFDEKILGNNYIATFKISFSKEFVDSILAKKNPKSSNSEKQQELSFLVLPIKVLPQRKLLWENSNNWKKSIADSINSKKINNFKLAEADIDNLAMLNSGNIDSISALDLDHFFSKYKVDIIYLILFSYDEEGKKASVVVRGFERLRKFQYRLGFINSKNLSEEDLLNKVANKVVEYLSDLKAEEIRAQSSKQETIRIEIPLTKLGDWLMIKNRLENSGLISKMALDSISADRAVIFISYNGALDIFTAFEKIGFFLTNQGEKGYILTLK